MDDISLYYDDPRNAAVTFAPGFGFMPMHGQPLPFFPQRTQAPPRRPVSYAAVPPPTVMVRAQAATAPPVYAQQPIVAQPVSYGGPVFMPAPSSRRTLRDLSLADGLALGAQVFAAIRPLPGAPTDLHDTSTNLVNQTKFLSAIASHFQHSQQLLAIGAVVNKLL